MNTAFFDLDKTILARNSATLWLKRELRLGYVTRWQALRAATWLVRYSLGAANMEDALRETINALAGSRERDLDERTLLFFETEIKTMVRPGALAALEAHRARGERVVLLTSSSPYLSRPVQRALSLDEILCTRLEVDDAGNFTGKPVEPICFGHGKVTLARGYLESTFGSLDKSAFYTDSTSDLPMLEAVGTPVAVNPDPRLRRIAKARGWQVVDWGEPALSAATSPA